MGKRRAAVDTAGDEPRFELVGHVCDWFLLCDNMAAGTVAHPALGPVWCCQRCADRFGLTVDPTS